MALIAGMSMVCPDIGWGQVHVAPPAVYLSEDRPSGRIEVLNTGDKTAEVTVDLGFGYPRTNSEGHIYMKLFEQISTHEPSAVDWIQIYPYRFDLAPNRRQTIRFAVFAPDSAIDQEYWARPIVSSKLKTESDVADTKSVLARIDVVQRTILALNYRHGNVYTKPVLDSMQLQQSDTHLEVVSHIKQQGNAAVLGNLIVELSEPGSGQLLHRKERQIAVYHDLKRILRWPLKELNREEYRVNVELNSRRSGPKSGDILPFETIGKHQIYRRTTDSR